jgi:membrane-bound serine protease (ClpP class)
VKAPLLRTFFVVACLAGALVSAVAAAPERGAVLAVEFENDVNPVTADYVIDEIDRANDENFEAVVIVLDTPGGLAEAMRDIYKKELSSRIPVIVFVAPEGARAASAGVWIGQAADVLAMAPQTNLGSSTPVASGGGEIPSDLKRKVVNDAAKSLRGLAEEHGRNGDWAEQAVRRASNLTAREALRMNVIDIIAPDLPTLLERLEGYKTKPKGHELHLSDARIERVEMSLWKKILDTLINPELIVLFLSVGTLGIIVELWNPGLIFPGTVGAISLILGLFGLQVLPISAAGLLLMLLAFAFFAAEAFIPSHGALTLAGACCFVLGALLLFDPAGESYEVSLTVVLAIAGTLALLMALVATKIVQVRKLKPVTGHDEMVGSVGVVRKALDPQGQVFVHGELWQAESEGERIPAGSQVRVESVDGLTLRVAAVT